MIDEYYAKLVADPVWCAIWGVFGMFVGVGIGHWLTLGRDRRAEFNIAAEKFFPVIRHEITYTSPMSDDVSGEAAVFIRHLSKFGRWRFDRILGRYKSACIKAKKRDATGSSYYEDPSEIRAILGELLTFTNRR